MVKPDGMDILLHLLYIRRGKVLQRRVLLKQAGCYDIYPGIRTLGA